MTRGRHSTKPTVRTLRGFRGFTLVELLVVVSIIMLLVLLVMPSLNKAGEAANRARCGSNIHQLGLALMNYAASNKTMFPDSTQQGGTWWWDISMDVRNQTVRSGAQRGVFYCPSSAHQDTDELWNYNTSYSVIGYSWVLRQSNHNRPPLITPNTAPASLRDAGAPDRTALIADATVSTDTGNFVEVTGGWSGVHRTSHLAGGDLDDEMLRKPAGGNVLAGDGGVKWRAWPQMEVRSVSSRWFYW